MGAKRRLRVTRLPAHATDPSLELLGGRQWTSNDRTVDVANEQPARAIEPFYTTKGSKQGSGLGLSMVFNYCEHAGGRFLLASEPGVGTQATIVLPLLGVVREEVAQAPESALEAPEESRTILVVEDDRSLRDGLALNFELEGFDVHTAVDGQEAIDLNRQLKPDIITMDAKMPRVDGFSAIREIMASQPVPIVMVTGCR